MKGNTQVFEANPNEMEENTQVFGANPNGKEGKIQVFGANPNGMELFRQRESIPPFPVIYHTLHAHRLCESLL